MLQPPLNNLLVSVKTKYLKHPSNIAKLSALENGTSIDLMDNVQIVGLIEALPKSISPFAEYKGYSMKDLKVGDTIIFSYQVIAEMRSVADSEPEFKNLITHEGKEYFLCDIKRVFAKVSAEGVEMVNGWMMLEEHEKSTIIVPLHIKKIRNAVASRVINVGHSRTHMKPIGVKQGDYVFYNGNHAQHYEINDKKFLIMPQEKIFGQKII